MVNIFRDKKQQLKEKLLNKFGQFYVANLIRSSA